MKNALLFSLANFAIIIFCSLSAQSQNVAITDDDSYTANSSSMLDVKSTNKGFLSPRLTTVQRNAIVTPATGLLVFDTSLNGFYYYNGTAWINLSSGSSSGLLWSYSSPNVYLTGASDKVGIGTSAPAHKLMVSDNVTLTDGTDGSFIDIQNQNNTTGVLSGIRFYNGTTANTYKGGIFYKDVAGFGRGDLILANNPVNGSGNVTTTDSRLTIKNTGGVEVKATTGAAANASLFHVLNATGDTIFAVYDGGVRINVYDDTLAKANTSKGGFAVGGFSPSKGTFTNDYLRITPDSIRMYIEEGNPNKATTSKGGFAVGGFSPSKTIPSDYFNIYGSNATTTLNPSEARIFWYPLKEAFLAGRVLVQSPDSVGTNSFASGYESKAVGNYSQALGYKCISRGQYSTALGFQSEAIGDNSFAIGYKAKAKGSNLPAVSPAFAFGNESYAKSGALALGNKSYANFSSVSIGTESSSDGQYAVALGYQSRADGYTAVAIGYLSKSNGSLSTAIGPYAKADGAWNTAIGFNAKVSGVWATSIGNFDISYNPTYGPNAMGNYSLAIGTVAKTGADGSVCISTALSDTCSSWGKNSYVIGSRVHSAKTGAIVFGDDPGPDPSSPYVAYLAPTVDNQFVARAKGGFQFFTSAALEATKSVFIKGNDGSVGIGTNAPTNKLDVEGDIRINDNNIFLRAGTDANHGLGWYGTGKTYAGFALDGPALYGWSGGALGHQNTIDLMWNISGNVGIGTTSPDNKLDVNGKLSVTQSAGNEMVVINGNAWTHSTGNQIFGTGGGYFLMASKEGMGESAGIRGDGNNVTIWSPGDGDRLLRLLDEDFFDATNTDPNDNSSEKAYINSAGQYFQVSDMNKKQNIVKIQSASSKISSLSGYTYEYKINQEEVNKGQQVKSTAGVLAQELQAIFPQAVQANESGELFVNYSAILPLLIEAIKEQQIKITNLETIVNQLQNK